MDHIELAGRIQAFKTYLVNLIHFAVSMCWRTRSLRKYLRKLGISKLPEFLLQVICYQNLKKVNEKKENVLLLSIH